MAHLKAWIEHFTVRLARLDYWNPAHIPTNASSKVFLHRRPGATSHLANCMKSEPDKDYTVRYFHRDYKVRARGTRSWPPLAGIAHPCPPAFPSRPRAEPGSS